MTKQEMQKKEARIGTIRKKMDEIPAMLDGTLMVKHNRVSRKDGSVHVSAGYHTFQYRGADGKRKWKRIPKNAKAAVERLVRAARRYRKLDREYSALLTELSLAHGGKKND
ncbi:MAG: hypothetical protein KAH38_07785 [Candidatus Hydrogenedentes bacterium]|nr:hypothetical protein [Candidatus Hydrogenedentota bacterium]